MDTSNWRPTQGPSGAVGDTSMDSDTSMESGDWRAQLQADSRQRIVNKIMDTLKRHLPFSGHEGLQELKKIAVRFEEKIYTTATSQSDYLRKISLKRLTMETRSQNPMVDARQANSAAQQQQQQQQQQSQYSQYLNQQQLHQLAKQKLQQTNITPAMQSHIQQQQQNLLQPSHLQSSQQSGMPPTMMQTPSLSTGVQTQRPVAPESGQLQQLAGLQQQPNLLPRDMQQRLPTSGGFQQQNVNDQQKLFQQQRPLPEASRRFLQCLTPVASLDSIAQMGNPNGGDWQEEVYQKVLYMKSYIFKVIEAPNITSYLELNKSS